MMKRLFGKTKKTTFSNPDGRPRLELDLERLQELKIAGKSNRELAHIFGCSEATIRNRIKQIKSAQ